MEKSQLSLAVQVHQNHAPSEHAIHEDHENGDISFLQDSGTILRHTKPDHHCTINFMKDVLGVNYTTPHHSSLFSFKSIKTSMDDVVTEKSYLAFLATSLPESFRKGGFSYQGNSYSICKSNPEWVICKISEVSSEDSEEQAA